MKKTWQNIQALWDNYKRYNVLIMRIPEGEERERRKEILETIENFSKLISDTNYRCKKLTEHHALPKSWHIGKSFSNNRKSKIKRKLLKKMRGKAAYL